VEPEELGENPARAAAEDGGNDEEAEADGEDE